MAEESSNSSGSSGGGGGGIISLSGTDWLGIGATASEAYKGTAMCGSRPNCLWTAECKRKTQAYEDCVRLSNEQMYQLGMAQTAAQQAAARNASQNSLFRKKWVMIGIIAIVAILLIWLIFRK